MKETRYCVTSLCGFTALVAAASWCFAGPMDEVLKSVCVVRTPDGLGTGFVVAESSLVATNFHVIQGAKEAEVEFLNGTTIKVAGFVVASPGYDLAVLRLVSDAPGAPLDLRAGDSDIGVDVFAVGNPKGLAGSVSKGVISGRRRWDDMKPLLGEGIHDFGYEVDSSWVQTDAAINGGNSGGPLCLADGTVIAVNTWGTTPRGGQNLNFAIDVSHLLHFLGRLPARPAALASLPPGVRAGQPAQAPRDAAAEQTRQYWRQMTLALGAFATERQKIAIEQGAFRPSAPRGGPPERLPAKSKYEADLAERRRRVTQRAMMAGGSQNLNSENAGYYSVLASASDAKKDIEKLDKALTDIGAAARRTAAALDSLAMEGVHPAVVEFAIDVAAAYRSLATDANDSARALKAQVLGGSFEDTKEALRCLSASDSDINRLLEVHGGELRARLRKEFHQDFEPVVFLNEDQLKLFDGEPLPAK